MSQINSESISSIMSNNEDLPKKLAFGIFEVLVKGAICGTVHLAVFTILKKRVFGENLR